VSETFADDLHRDAGSERQARAGVPQVVQSNHREAGLLGEGLESAKSKPQPIPAPLPEVAAPAVIEANEPAPARSVTRSARIAAERPVHQRRGMQAPV